MLNIIWHDENNFRFCRASAYISKQPPVSTSQHPHAGSHKQQFKNRHQLLSQGRLHPRPSGKRLASLLSFLLY